MNCVFCIRNTVSTRILRNSINSSLYIRAYTQYIVYSLLYTVHCILWTVYSIQYALQYILTALHTFFLIVILSMTYCVMWTVHFYTVYCILYVLCTVYCLHKKPLNTPWCYSDVRIFGKLQQVGKTLLWQIFKTIYTWTIQICSWFWALHFSRNERVKCSRSSWQIGKLSEVVCNHISCRSSQYWEANSLSTFIWWFCIVHCRHDSRRLKVWQRCLKAAPAYILYFLVNMNAPVLSWSHCQSSDAR